jgi:hypothetical protein
VRTFISPAIAGGKQSIECWPASKRAGNLVSTTRAPKEQTGVFPTIFDTPDSRRITFGRLPQAVPLWRYEDPGADPPG